MPEFDIDAALTGEWRVSPLSPHTTRSWDKTLGVFKFQLTHHGNVVGKLVTTTKVVPRGTSEADLTRIANMLAEFYADALNRANPDPTSVACHYGSSSLQLGIEELFGGERGLSSAETEIVRKTTKFPYA